MKRKNTLLATFAILGLISILGNRGGALPGNTGAPGEDTCGRGGCHGVTPNQGNATVSINFNGEGGTFTPGSTNTVEVTIENPMNASRNGFMIVALDDQNNNVGEWELTDATNTRERDGSGELEGRKYVTQTRDGSSQMSWSMNWIAPADAAPDSVVFYLAYNDANANGNASGDDVYTIARSIFNDAVSSVNQLDPNSIELYPNPATEWIRIQSDQYDFQQYAIFDLSGRKVTAGVFNPSIPVDRLDEGMYVLKLRAEEGELSTKVLIH